MQIEDELSDYQWSWDQDQQLLRDAPNLGDIEVDYNASVDIYGVPYVQGGGRASFFLAWATTEPDTPVLVESRDFTDDDEYAGVPLIGNARIVPSTDRLYGSVYTILTQLTTAGGRA